MNIELRWQQRLESLGQALERLEEALSQDSWGDLEKDGVIQRFEFCFELAWKTLQNFLEEQGYKNVKGPKKVIQQAFQDGYLDNGEDWINILEDRNRLSHTYDKNISTEIFEKIQNRYFQDLCDLESRLKKELQK